MHEAADGGLARVRLPGGVLTADQLRVLAEASAELGDGRLELTSRANLQIRALRPGAPRQLSDRLYAAGLLPSITHERVRNILASPLSGLDEHSRYDVLPAAAELDRLIRADERFAELPGRFLFALDDGRGDLARSGADVAVRMLTRDQAALLLAGRDSGLRPASGRLAETMLAAAGAFLDERAAQQSAAWRLSELTDGPDAILRRLARSGVQAGEPEAFAPGDAETAGRVGRALVVVVPLGSLEQAQAAVLADVAREGLRITPWRSVVLPGVEDDAVLRAAGLVVDPESPWNGVTACAGRPGCAKALADVRADARKVVPGLAAGHRPVHWSGCERRCGRPAGDFLDVVAVPGGYSIDDGPAVPAERVDGRL